MIEIVWTIKYGLTGVAEDIDVKTTPGELLFNVYLKLVDETFDWWLMAG